MEARRLPSSELFSAFAASLDGDLFHDQSWRLMYATDASVYRELPAAVCRPAHADDLKKVLAFCQLHQLPIIPRTAGTSLAGQVVGHGLVVDFSRYMNKILELNTAERWVRVEPGVILDDLNRYLEPHGLFFGPETSTSNRCMIGGMVANNSCGSHSLVYGSTRDHTIEIDALLADGSPARFGPLDPQAFRDKCIGSKLENKIYSHLFQSLSDQSTQDEIRARYPDPRINRRNTGYALDLLLNSRVFGGEEDFNMSKLLCGSEGTLALFTSIKLNLVDLPPPEKALVCVHVKSIRESLLANLVALRHQPVAVELIDHHVLECTRNNIQQSRNRFFIQGEPGAILVVEFACNSREEATRRAAEMEAEMRDEGLGYHFPVLFDGDINRVWALRKAGLGLLSNIPGDAKPVAVIEDSAVHVEALPAFIGEVQEMLDRLGLQCVYYAHIGTGELHLRPVLNLKVRTDVERFYKVAEGMAGLVKKYRGSLSGEHGDGRLRAQFIPLVLGERCHELLCQLKGVWDPQELLNPGKIVHSPSMKEHLRYSPGQRDKKIGTFLDFEENKGFLRAVEQCNGSGDCRKPHAAGGVMCPSYQATLNEYDSTRGRANLLREFITHSSRPNPFDHREIIDVLDLCLSCKGCKAECPSNVDVGKYKAEALQQYYMARGTPLGARITGAYGRFNSLGSKFPGLFNFVAGNALTAPLVKMSLGIARQRQLPKIQPQSLRAWAAKHLSQLNENTKPSKEVNLFCDEFTNYNDTSAGISACLLLHKLGYRVHLPRHQESGRTYLSKGLLKKAKAIAQENVRALSPLISADNPLVGVEPSAILSFRDEYPSLLRGREKEGAISMATHCYTLEEFLAREVNLGRIEASLFNPLPHPIYLHGHCHQKALSSMKHSLIALGLAAKGEIRQVDCGCCGMAGSFGYEKKHYELSMQIGEMALFPALREAPAEAIIVAAGTSCRHQILDGTGRKALHPAEVLLQAVR